MAAWAGSWASGPKVAAMRSVRAKRVLLTAIALAIAGGFFLIGHLTVDSSGARDKAYQSGHTDGYFDGLNAGENEGRQEGRALQAASTVPAGSQQVAQDGFNAGYVAGENDAFGNFDGGWALSVPYVVTVARSQSGAVYRITNRTLLAAGTAYYLCPDGHTVCTAPRHQ
jgi:hypothetical protein